MGLKAVANRTAGGTPVTTANFVDGEVPSGTKDGVNTAFTLASTPSPALSLQLVYNGFVMKAGVGYTLSGANITAIAPYLPNTSNGDTYEAWYRIA